MGDFRVAIKQEFKVKEILLNIDFNHGRCNEWHDPVTMN
jgi:hypothetical protein